MLKTFIGERKSGLLFATRKANSRTNRILAANAASDPGQTNQTEMWCFMLFPPFSQPYLKNRTSCPEGVRHSGLGWEDKDMSDLHDKIREEVSFRREWAGKPGLGVEIPRCHEKSEQEQPNILPKSALLDGMDGKAETPDVH